MRRFLFGNLEIYTYLCKKLSYTRCYVALIIMKTIIIFNDIESPLQFLLVDGDYSKFHGVFVNAVNGTGYEEEFCDWMFEKETGERKHKWSDDKSLLENKNWDKVAICTWIP